MHIPTFRFALPLFFFLALASSTQAQPFNLSGVIINEVYYDITSNYNGNWNGGNSSITTDQFIELYNTSTNNVNIGSWLIANGNSFAMRIKIDTLWLLAQTSVIFAKDLGNYTPPPGHLAFDVDSIGNLSGSWLFNTSGDCIFLVNPGPSLSVGDPSNDDEWITFSYENANQAFIPFANREPKGTLRGHENDGKNCVAQSINRNPDITGQTWDRHLTLNASNACSPNKKVNNSDPLPVVFSSFNVSLAARNNAIRLAWTTTGQHNTLGYAIERRSDVRPAWEERGTVAATCGAGCIGDYEFTDAIEERDGFRFSYRLRIITTDGSVEYSPVVSLDAIQPERLAISSYPNPISSSAAATLAITVPPHLNGAPIAIDLYDRLGRLVRSIASVTAQTGMMALPLETKELSAGIYICRVSVGMTTSVRAVQVMK